MVNERDTQQVKVKSPPKSPPAKSITVSDLKKYQGGSVKGQSIPKGAK
jgi:hypothetical protein